MMNKKFITGWIILLLSSLAIPGENSLYIPKNIGQAFQKKTRNENGKPGQNYWQNRADYLINVELQAEQRSIVGTETINYKNNSPDTLSYLIIHLFPNLYKKGNPREFKLDPSDETDGLTIRQLSVENTSYIPDNDSARYEYILDDLALKVYTTVIPGDQVSVQIAWNYTVNKNSHMRTGMVDETSFFIAYFFPRIAVYDDIDGWNKFKYTGVAEFYNDFGDFDVSVTVPNNQMVWATGQLQNRDDLLSVDICDRLDIAAVSDTIVAIIDSTEHAQNSNTIAGLKNSWHFVAHNVSDFAFAVSDHYLWDATSLEVDKSTGRRVLINAVYNKESRDFYNVAKIARDAIRFMSTEIPGVPFPFPHETVFNGLDEMEYPMMVNNMSVDDPHYLIKLTSHEIFHSYFPFYMGINETRYAWMDEGMASFGDHQISTALDGPEYATYYYNEEYQTEKGHHMDTPMITESAHLTRPVYHFNSYVKPGTFFSILQNELGANLFKKTLRGFMKDWNGKHPTPWDLFNSFNHYSGQNLNWLFQPWFFEFGYVDLALGEFKKTEKNYTVTINRVGRYPAPAQLKISYKNDKTEIVLIKASVWKDGRKSFDLHRPLDNPIRNIELLDLSGLDVNPANNR